MKFDKRPYIIYADFDHLINKKLINVQAIQKNLQLQKHVNIFPTHIQCQLYLNFIVQKVSIVYIVGKIV